uniref:Uncharacterized protein n=2 Tax=Picea TaxID=3328 RepID=A0A101LXM2_PICGL|nr:hypothetical protein ABT39_MTgene5424 [Picea glauca]QHR91483.1 hypothetical protein Q903MT_gene5518 [Picea sitchensis]
MPMLQSYRYPNNSYLSAPPGKSFFSTAGWIIGIRPIVTLRCLMPFKLKCLIQTDRFSWVDIGTICLRIFTRWVI